MRRKWKKVSALGMAVLLGCLMPTNTMLAVEEDTEAVQELEADSVTDADEVSEDEIISDDNESVDDEVDNIVEENADDEADTDIDGNGGIALMSETDGPEAGDVAVQSAAPVINITWQGKNCSYSLGGDLDYTYISNHDQAFEFSASQDGQTVSLYYYLEGGSTIAKAKEEGQMGSLSWTEALSSSERVCLSNDKSYVLYVKAVGADGQITYARSGEVVVDTIAPDATKLVDGGTYPEGTEFQVSDANLESVKVNEVDVTSGWNAVYQVTANGTSSSCVIRLKDKAGNEKVYSVNVSRDTAEDGVISANGIYSLQTGTSYQLAAGTWQVGGDGTVYQGGRTFYVKSAGNYSFTKR